MRNNLFLFLQIQRIKIIWLNILILENRTHIWWIRVRIPLPALILGGSSKNISSFDEQQSSVDKKKGANERMVTLNIQKSKGLEIDILEEAEIVKKIESITKSLRKQYFKNSLLNLLEKYRECKDPYKGVEILTQIANLQPFLFAYYMIQ